MSSILEKLKCARRVIDELSEIELLHDWRFENEKNRWYLKVRIAITKSSCHVPIKTDWYVVVTSAYPYGYLKIYPSVTNSISVTFQHQSNNSKVNENRLWREGNLCTEVIDGLYEKEPYENDTRLLYHLKRTIYWLEAAADNNLIHKGELFEIPDFKIIDSSPIFVFSEDSVSFMQWESIEGNYGLADLYKIKENPHIYRVISFQAFSDGEHNYVDWGDLLKTQNTELHNAVWLKLHSIPVVNVWQAPSTFKELKQTCTDQGVNIFQVLQSCSSKIRDGKQHMFLLGFPVSKYIGGENESIHWQALLLPVLSYGKKTQNGFRPNENGWWMRDKQETYKDDLDLNWLKSENWNGESISQRGRMANSLQYSNIAIIGCGCMGASIAEILVRAAVCSFTVIDCDLVEIGNLSRHILSIEDIGKSKAEAVKKRLNLINPHAIVTAEHKELCLDEEGICNVNLNPFDIIIDCTGENEVFGILSSIDFVVAKKIISISVGLNAEKLYVNAQNCSRVNYDMFNNIILEYLMEDSKRMKDMTLPRNGTGCWHTTFPARSDDVWAAAAVATKAIEVIVENIELHELTMVFERKDQDGFFLGYELIEKVKHG